MAFRTYIIGRGRDADIRVVDETVSRSHAELTVTDGGRYYLADRNSMHGTWVRSDEGWSRHHQGYVDLGERLRFGHVETHLRELLWRSSFRLELQQPSQDPNSVHEVDDSNSDRFSN